MFVKVMKECKLRTLCECIDSVERDVGLRGASLSRKRSGWGSLSIYR